MDMTEDVTAALERVLTSREFRSSARMRSFLTYVVREALEGRPGDIRAKTIAMDVYGYDADDLSRREGVVRVDAGRVRRKLDAYYRGAGQSDPLVITLPVGSYAPMFTSGRSGPAPLHKTRFRTGMLATAVVLVCVLAVAYVAWTSKPDKARDTQTTLYDVAPARVEAINLGSAGRDLIFPVVEPSRLQPALLLFETAIQRDPHYFGGYAGLAQVETILALLNPKGPDADALLAAADKHSAYALDLAPDTPWALSARAWLEFGIGAYEQAEILSHRAIDLAPGDPHIAEFDTLISLYTLNFDRILAQSEQYLDLAERSGGPVFDNALGAAQFHTGDHAAAIGTYQNTIARGGPFGPISAAYLLAAHWNNGDRQEARRLARIYTETWPDFPLEALKKRAFASPEPVDALIASMKAAGWSEPGIREAD